MASAELRRYLPSIAMAAEEFEALGWPCHVTAPEPDRAYRGARLYSGQKELDEDVLYLLTEETADSFPVDRYAFVSVVSVAGSANHILVPGRDGVRVLEVLTELFGRYREQEAAMDRLVMTSGSLDELCQLGEDLSGCPVCIHDDWFIIVAMSRELPRVMPPERVAESNKGFVPRMYVESFKNNEEYSKTYETQGAKLWYSEPGGKGSRTLYANLWDGEIYMGRLLMPEGSKPFRPSHWLLADCLAQRAALILLQQKGADRRDYRTMDDIAFRILDGTSSDPAEVSLFLDTLGWRRTDRLLCIQLQTQQTDHPPAMDHMLHSELFQLFPDSYIMFVEQRQCLILNLSKESLSVPQVRHQLAAVCRDYYLYAGISSPVWGVEELRYAFRQTAIALEQAFFLRNERWVIPFSTIVLDYVLRKLPGGLPIGYLVAPELLELLSYDRQKGTEYFATLRTFLQCERDIPRTSEALIIHRTTLLYRLKKIHAITGLNLDDAEARLYLLLSLRMLEQMD